MYFHNIELCVVIIIISFVQIFDLSLTKIPSPPSTIKQLHKAASLGDLARVKYFIGKCDCTCTDDDGNSALHHAVMGGHINVVQYLTTIEQVNPASPGKGSNTPLHFASMHGYLDIITFLINEQLVDPLCYNDDKQTPFFLACKYGHLEVAKTVLEALYYIQKVRRHHI